MSSSKISVIALTGHHNYLDLARAAGCDAFLTKPCEPATLLEKVNEVLGEASAAVGGKQRTRSN